MIHKYFIFFCELSFHFLFLSSFIYLFVFLIYIFYWSLFQVHSKAIQLYIHTYIIFQIIFHYRLLQDIDYSSLVFSLSSQHKLLNVDEVQSICFLFGGLYFFRYNFIYLFLAVLCLHCCTGFLLAVASNVYSLVAECFSLRWLLFCRAQALG